MFFDDSDLADVVLAASLSLYVYVIGALKFADDFLAAFSSPPTNLTAFLASAFLATGAAFFSDEAAFLLASFLADEVEGFTSFFFCEFVFVEGFASLPLFVVVEGFASLPLFAFVEGFASLPLFAFVEGFVSLPLFVFVEGVTSAGPF